MTPATLRVADLNYNDWEQAQLIVFHHGWPLTPTTGTIRCCFSCVRVTALLRLIAAATADQLRSRPTMTWITMRPMLDAVVERLDLKNAIAYRPLHGRWTKTRATSLAMGNSRVVSQSWC